MAAIGRLRSLWRGEIALRNTFWFFGVTALLLFPLIFISLQPTITSSFGKHSTIILYFDYFLAALYAAYGIFMIVAVWRSSNKYRGPKRWSRLAKLVGIVIVFWFASNLGLYVYIKTFIPPVFEAKIDYVPQKLTLPRSVAQPDSLYWSGFKLAFPFYREDIKKAYPFFIEHHPIHVTIYLADNKGALFINETPDSLPEARPSISTNIEKWFFDGKFYGSYFETMGQVHYARLRDYSWWNLRDNLKLSVKLILKLISIPAIDNLRVYDVETPYLRGYLKTGSLKNNRVSIDFEFPGKGKTYSLHAVAADDGVANKIMSILGSVQPVLDINEGYRIMEAQYKHKNMTRYPDDILLLSLISLKGPTLNNLKELLRIEENIPDNKYAVESISKEVEFLSSTGQKEK